MNCSEKTVLRVIAAVLIAAFVSSGCRSSKTIRMYTGPELPADQLTALVVPWCIGVRSIDGIPAPSNFLDELRLVLKPGPHTVVARYVVSYPVHGNEFEKITSDYLELPFSGEAGRTYAICTENPRTLEESRAYAAKNRIWIDEVKGGSAKNKSAEAPVKPEIKPTAQPAAPALTNSVSNPDSSTKLQEAWDKASEQERKALFDKLLEKK